MKEIEKVNEHPHFIAKVIPLAFDESMSYYECICQLTDKINEMLEVFNGELTDELKEYIDKRFNDIMIDTMYDPETETLILYLSREEKYGKHK